MKKALISLSFLLNLYSHPVSYTINLDASYNENTKIVTLKCESSSKNKCGLHNFHLLDEKDNIISSHKFPFLKKEIKIKSKVKPKKIDFHLRKIPEHKYIVFF